MEQKTKQNKKWDSFLSKILLFSLLKWTALEMGWVAMEGTVKVQLGAWDESDHGP